MHVMGGVRFDFYAENSSRIIEVEMQVKPDKEIMRHIALLEALLSAPVPMSLAELAARGTYSLMPPTKLADRILEV